MDLSLELTNTSGHLSSYSAEHDEGSKLLRSTRPIPSLPVQPAQECEPSISKRKVNRRKKTRQRRSRRQSKSTQELECGGSECPSDPKQQQPKQKLSSGASVSSWGGLELDVNSTTGASSVCGPTATNHEQATLPKCKGSWANLDLDLALDSGSHHSKNSKNSWAGLDILSRLDMINPHAAEDSHDPSEADESQEFEFDFDESQLLKLQSKEQEVLQGHLLPVSVSTTEDDSNVFDFEDDEDGDVIPVEPVQEGRAGWLDFDLDELSESDSDDSESSCSDDDTDDDDDASSSSNDSGAPSEASDLLSEGWC